MRTLALLTLLALSSFSAQAADYYFVATNGSDSNPGTEAAPFATFQKAIDLLNEPDDRIYVKAGTYTQRMVVWGKSGSLSYPIRIQGYSGARPILDGAGMTSGNGMVEIGGGSSHIIFEQFEVRNAPNSGILIYDGNNVQILNNHVHGCRTFGIHAMSASASPRGTTHTITIADNLVYNNVRENSTGTASSWRQGLSAYRATNVKILRNWVYENFGEGIDYIMSTDGLISENVVRDNFSANIYLDNAADTTVERNFVHTYLKTAHYRHSTQASGIVIAAEYYYENGVQAQIALNNLKIVNNIILRARNGITYGNWEYDSGLHNTLIANNTVYAPVYYNLYLLNGRSGQNVHSSTYVENNLLVQDGASKDYTSSSSATVGITYSYNNWWGGDSTSRINGAGDVNGDPKFVELAGWDAADYAITTGSACINVGRSQTAFNNDYFTANAVRSSGSWDIGADEL